MIGGDGADLEAVAALLEVLPVGGGALIGDAREFDGAVDGEAGGADIVDRLVIRLEGGELGGTEILDRLTQAGAGLTEVPDQHVERKLPAEVVVAVPAGVAGIHVGRTERVGDRAVHGGNVGGIDVAHGNLLLNGVVARLDRGGRIAQGNLLQRRHVDGLRGIQPRLFEGNRSFRVHLLRVAGFPHRGATREGQRTDGENGEEDGRAGAHHMGGLLEGLAEYFHLNPFAYVFNDRIERRCNQDAQEGRHDHTGEGRDADGAAAHGAGTRGNDQREHTEEERPGRHQHGAITHVEAVDGRFGDAQAAFALRLGEFYHQNGVLSRESDKHDQSELGINAQRHMAVAESEEGSERGHRDGGDHRNRDGPALILRHQKEIGKQQCQRHQCAELLQKLSRGTLLFHISLTLLPRPLS